jgi:hypothetical protein
MIDSPEVLPQPKKYENPDGLTMWEQGYNTGVVDRDIVVQPYWDKALDEKKRLEQSLSEYKSTLRATQFVANLDMDWQDNEIETLALELASANKRIEELEQEYAEVQDIADYFIELSKDRNELETEVARLTEAQRIKLEYIAELEIKLASQYETGRQSYGKGQGWHPESFKAGVGIGEHSAESYDRAFADGITTFGERLKTYYPNTYMLLHTVILKEKDIKAIQAELLGEK